MNEKVETETFYDRYCIHIWYAFGYLATASTILNPSAIEKAGFLLSFIVSFGVAVPVAFLLFTIYVFSSFIISLIFDGVKEKNIRSIFMAIYFIIWLNSIYSGSSLNA